MQWKSTNTNHSNHIESHCKLKVSNGKILSVRPYVLFFQFENVRPKFPNGQTDSVCPSYARRLDTFIAIICGDSSLVHIQIYCQKPYMNRIWCINLIMRCTTFNFCLLVKDLLVIGFQKKTDSSFDCWFI